MVIGRARLRRQRKVKGRALARCRFDPDASAVPFDDFLTQRQPDALLQISLPGVGSRHAPGVACPGDET